MNRLKEILHLVGLRKKAAKTNLLRKGLKVNKKLKDGFYYFIYEKNIDWAIILGSLFVVLPYIASKKAYFLLPKIIIVAVLFGLIAKYLWTWNELRKFKEKQAELKKVIKKLIGPSKSEASGKLLEELTSEFKILGEKAKMKSHLYKTFEDYRENEKLDFKAIQDLLNKDQQLSKTSYGEIIMIISSIFIIREIPILEMRNYYRLIAVVLLVLLFFILYFFEVWFI